LRRAVAGAALLLLAGRPAAAEDLTLQILHTTDLHGAVAAWDDIADRPAPRGLERLATLIGAQRAGGTPTLLLDAGDALSGSGLVRTWRAGGRARPDPVIAAMNALGYDAMALGNHDLDAGRAGLDSAVAAAKFAILGANVVDAATGRPALDATLIRTVGGVRVGIIGLTTPAMPMLMDSSLYRGLRFLDPVEIARSEVSRLRGAEHCEVVVALAHTGLGRDPAAAAGTARARPGEVPNENVGDRLAYEVPGLDAVILGHTHEVISSTTIGGAIVTQAGRNGEQLGRIEFRLTRESPLAPWKVAGRSASLLAVTDSVTDDPAIHALVAPYVADARTALDEVVGEATAPLDAPYGRFGDSPLWRTIQRCQLEVSGADVSLAALFDPAQTIARGPIRRRDLLRLYPYDNSLGVIELTGAGLRATLEHAAAMLAPYAWDGASPILKPDAAGFQFDAAYGVDYEIDLTRPEGSRIVNLKWHGQPLDPAQRLKVVANSYRLAGGGDYRELRAARRVARIDGAMPDLLVRWLRDRKTLDAAGEPTWRLLPDYAGAPERRLIDRLVRLGAAPRAEVMRLGAALPARRVDLAYWLARVFDMRAQRASNAWGDVPDSLRVWLDGIRARGVLGNTPGAARFQPWSNATVGLALDWCERTARAEHYAIGSAKLGDPAFRRSLLTGVSGPGAPGPGELLSRAQWLGILSNLRFPWVRVLETTDFHGAILAARTTGARSGPPAARGRWWPRSSASARGTPRARCCSTAVTCSRAR